MFGTHGHRMYRHLVLKWHKIKALEGGTVFVNVFTEGKN
jgi:hypothetical protein